MKRIVSFVLCAMGSVVMGMEEKSTMTMPSPRSLQQRFDKASLTDFARHSRLPSRVGGKQCDTAGLEFAIKSSVINYQFYISSQPSKIDHLRSLEDEVKRVMLGK